MNARWTVAVGSGLIAATLLLGFVLRSGLPAFDPAIMRALAGQREAAGFWRAMTWLGDGERRALAGVLAAALLVYRSRLWSALLLMALTLAQSGFNSALKAFFGRPRPDLLPHLDRVSDLSYPSGHAAQSAALYLLVALLIDRRLLWLAIPLVALIGVSRVVLGVHWPSDVLGGWLEGAGIALIGWGVARGSFFAGR